jgi:hypothetical protein
MTTAEREKLILDNAGLVHWAGQQCRAEEGIQL